MNRKEKLKLENMKKVNELLDKGHSQQYPTREPVVLQPSDNVRNSSKSFVNKMNNLKESTVSTTSRKERANMSPEAMQDLEAFHPELKKDLFTMEDIDKELNGYMEGVDLEVDRINEIMSGEDELEMDEACGDEVIIKEPNHTDNHHKGSYMAKQQLYNIAKKAQSVHDRLDDSETLEDWMESKIAQMSDNIDSVSNSFDYDEHEDHDGDVVTTIELEMDEACGDGEMHEGGCGDDMYEDEDVEANEQHSINANSYY
tara:strand:- start:289 stop:1059 length:771 start_codon:yes stop_codon:yes gene_type:complete